MEPILPYNQKELHFVFAAPFYGQPGLVSFQYRLKGFIDTWSGWSIEPWKDYTNLSEGRYEFQVRARNDFGTISTPAIFTFHILPPWYRSLWAFALSLLAIIAFMYGGSRWLIAKTHRKVITERKKIERIRKGAEEDVRRKVAADFHDELGTRITRISLFSEILKNRVIDKQTEDAMLLQKINDNAHHLYDETRDFIWQIDPQKDTLLDLITRLKTFGDELFENSTMRFEISSLHKSFRHIRLSMDLRQHLLRIFQEAMHNALKYANGQKIHLNIGLENNRLQICLQDDGRGFELSAQNLGYGLKNMRERAKNIGGELTIESEPGSGTTVCFFEKLPE